MIELQATCQTLKTCCHDMLVSDSLNAIKMRFVFSDEWDGMTKTAQFTQKKNNTSKYVTYNVLLDEDETAMLPNEIESGVVLVSVFGVNSIERMTTNTVAFPIMKSGFVGDGQTPIPPTPDLYQQLVMKVLNTAGSPVIGENGNWYLDNIDTGIKADWSAEQANAAASAAAAAQSAKDAAETLNSIPEDYTQMVAEVGQLSEDIADFSTIEVGRLVQWRRGGLYASGKIYVDQSKNRIVSTLVSLRKGDVISSADGYALAVNFYSYYTSDDAFEMITRQTMTEDPIAVPVDCVAFIGAKKTDDAAFTADEILTANHFVHIPDQHKGVSELLAKGAEENAFRNIAGIPVNALAFYDKWAQEIPSSKYAYVREMLGYADSTENYPVYLYRFDLYNNWVDSNYAYNNYTPEKDNALYRKPRILVTSGIHGNERATPVAVMAFVKNMLENPAYAHLLGQYDWFFVPLVNPWGFSHSVIDADGNVVYNNSPSWTNDTLPDGYTIIENTMTQCGGIRRNASSMDINRDFSDLQYVYNTNTYGFATPEAQAILTAAQTYGFDMVFDLHHSFDAATESNAPKCGYVRMQYAPRSGEPAAERMAFYREASAVNSKVDNYFRELYGNGVSKPMSLIWNGGTNPSIMNYFGGYEASDGTGNSANKDLACAYAFCVETSQVCYPLSLYENGWYNSIANHYTNVYCAELMRRLVELTK